MRDEGIRVKGRRDEGRRDEGVQSAVSWVKVVDLIGTTGYKLQLSTTLR